MMTILINAPMLLAGIALIVCAMYLLDRAGRCEVSARVGLAVLLALSGVISVGIALVGGATWLTALASSLSAAAAWLAIGTRYGRRYVHINGWGITRPDALSSDQHGEQAK